MRKKSLSNTIKALALFLACLLSSVAFAQQPPQPCHITITSDFESLCLVPLEKQDIYNEEPGAIIACQENTVNYTASTNTGGVPVVQWNWSVAGASSWTDNGNGSITVTWGNGSTGQITVEITTAANYTCSTTQNIRLIEKPTVYASSVPAYTVTQNNEKIIYVCKGETIEFTDLSNTTNSDIVGYYWESDHPTITASTPNFRLENVMDGCKVIHRVYNNCGCYDEEIYFVKVKEGELLKLGCYGTVCHNAVVTYTAENPSCGIYSWYVEGGTIIGRQDRPSVTVQWDHPENGYGIIGLDGILCGEHACPSMLSKKIPIIEDTIDIKGQDVACVGEAVIYSIPLFGSTRYTWDIQPSNYVTLNNINGANQQSVIFNRAGIYTITVSYECEFLECGEFTSKPLTIEVKPKLEINGEDRICVTKNCDLRTEPNVAALWKVEDIDNDAIIHTEPNTSNFSYHFPHAGKYRITAEHPDYCRPAVFVITVVSAPPAPEAIDFDPANPHVACPHSGILLKATPTNPDYTIVWQPTCNDADPESVSGNQVTIDFGNTVCDINAFNYDRVLGCLSEDPYVHTVSQFQLANHTLPTNITVCPGAELNFSVPNQSNVIYKWQLQSNEQQCASVQGDIFSNSISLLINELNNYPKTFTLTLKREYCSNMTDYHTINITIANNYNATLIITAPSQVCQFSEVQLSGQGCNNSYTWFIEDEVFHGETISHTFNNTGTIPVTMKCNPYYSCPNSDYYVTKTKSINVVPAPPVTGIGYDPNSIPDPSVHVVPLSLTTTNYDFFWGHTPTNNNTVAAIAGQWNYTCTVVDKNSPHCAKTVSANVQPCLNTLNLVYTPYDYCTSEVTVQVTNATDNITWNINGGECSIVSMWGTHYENIRLRINKAGTYTVNARMEGEPCQSGSVSFPVSFVQKFIVRKGCGKIVIDNKSSYLNGNAIVRIRYNNNFVNFQVQQSTVSIPVPSGTYNLSLISFNGININCPLGSVTIANTSNQQVSIALPNLTSPLYQTCDNTAIQLSASIAPHSVEKITWGFGDNSYSSHSNPIYHTFRQKNDGPYYVTATITDENNCISTGTVTVWSNENNLIPEQLTADGAKVCEGVQRQLIYDPAFATDYYWTTTGHHTYTNIDFVQYTGDYHVDVIDQYYCKGKKTQNVSFYNVPTALIVTASTIYCEGETIKFYGSPDPDSNSYTFDWVITDLTYGTTETSHYATVSYTPSHAGNYLVTLTISSGNGCSASTSETIKVNPRPQAPTIFFNGNECLDQGAVNLSGTTPTTPPSIINWSNGYTGPDANYFTSGEARAWYYDINTGCKSREATINIEPQPDFDALLTGCYKKCKDFFSTNPKLPVWGLTSGHESIVWRWSLNNNLVVPNGNGTIYYPDYTLMLPLTGFGDYTLNLRYHGGNCPVTSPTLTIEPKDTCDCKDLDVTYEYKWHVKECRLVYKVMVKVCNNSNREACLNDIQYLFDKHYINVVNSSFTPTTLIPGDCYTFHMTIEARQFMPSSIISFSIFDRCNHCKTDFSINLMPEKIDCEMPMKVIDIEINRDLSNEVAGYFKFLVDVNPAQNVFSFWTEPPMVIDYGYDGLDFVYGMNMIDMSLLSQLVAEKGDICFYALTCFKDKICLRKYCMPAEKLYYLFLSAGTIHKSAASNAEQSENNNIIDELPTTSPRLMPNPTSGEVNVIGTTDEVVEVLVMDMNGRKMATFENSTYFNISDLSSGIYIVRVKTKPDTSANTGKASQNAPLENVTYLKLVKK